MFNATSAPFPSRLNVLAIEPRMLFDGAGAVTAVNHDPVGEADCRTVAADSAIFDGAAVAGNLAGDHADHDPDGDTLRVAGIISGDWGGTPVGNVGTALDGVYGSILMQSDGTYTYTPYADLQLAPGQQVADTFTYALCDDRGGKSSTTLTVHVTSPNHNPIANADQRTVNADLDAIAGNVVRGSRPGEAADTDADGDYLLVTGVTAGNNPDVGRGNLGTPVQGQYGVLTLYADGGYRYDPNSNLQLPVGARVQDVFSYLICDQNGGEARTTFTISLNGPEHTKPVDPVKPVNPGKPVIDPAPVIPAPDKQLERETTVQTVKQTPPNYNSAIFVAPLAVPGLTPFSDIRPASLDVQRLEMPRDSFAPFASERVLGEVQETPAEPEKVAVAKPAVPAAQDDCVEADKPVAKLKPKVIKPTVLIKPELSGKQSFSEQVSVAKKGFVPPAKVRTAQAARTC